MNPAPPTPGGPISLEKGRRRLPGRATINCSAIGQRVIHGSLVCGAFQHLVGNFEAKDFFFALIDLNLDHAGHDWVSFVPGFRPTKSCTTFPTANCLTEFVVPLRCWLTSRLARDIEHVTQFVILTATTRGHAESSQFPRGRNIAADLAGSRTRERVWKALVDTMRAGDDAAFAQRSGFQKSGVSQNTHLIECHPSRKGYFWTECN